MFLVEMVAGMAIGWRARAALIKGMTIFGFAIGVLGWANWGLIARSAPEPIAMSAVGALALLVNLSIAVMLFRFRSGDANRQSNWVCSRKDAINNVVIIGAKVAVTFTGSGLLDLPAAFIMAAIGLHEGWQNIFQARCELGTMRATA